MYDLVAKILQPPDHPDVSTSLREKKSKQARLAQSVERKTLNLKAAGSTPALGSIPNEDISDVHKLFCFSLLCLCLESTAF